MCEWSEWREGARKGVRIEAMTARCVCVCECECECDCECMSAWLARSMMMECECDRDCECAKCVAGEI
jgi:hypothetical protein